MEELKRVEVVAAVIVKDGKIFCCKRGSGRALEGYWEFPGGKIKDGETKEQALQREIKEELKSYIQVRDLITTVEYDYPTFHIVLHAFKCLLVSGSLELTEHTSKGFFKLEELDGMDFAVADKQIISKLNEEFLLKKKINIGSNILKAIYQKKWLRIEYQNEQKELTRFLTGIKFLFAKNRIFIVEASNIQKKLETEERRIISIV